MKKFDQNEFNAQAGTFVVDAVLGSCSYLNYHAVAKLWRYITGDMYQRKTLKIEDSIISEVGKKYD